MPEQITETPQTTQSVQPVPVEPKRKSGLKIIVISLIVISLIVGGVYAGMQLEKKKVKVWTKPPLTEITPQPTEVIDETASWKTYADSVAKFEIKYPANWSYTVKQKTTTFSTLDQSNKKTYSGNVSLMGTEGQVDLVFGDGFGGGPCQEMMGSSAKLVDIKIGNYTVPLCNYVQAEKVYYASPFGDAGGPITPNASYNFSFSYLESFTQSKELILKILSTFKFIDQKETRFTCPQNGWQDCIPIMDEEKKLGCSAEAEGWYKTNCPDFKGFAQ